MVTAISAIVFAGVLSAYIFLGRGLVRQGIEEELVSNSRQALYDFSQDMSAASAVVSANATTLTVNTWIPQAAANSPVMATVTYQYLPAEFQLTMTRTAPPAATLAFPNWPTPFSNSPYVLLNNVTNFNFGTYDMNGNATGIASLIKQVTMSFTASGGSRNSGSASQLIVVSPQVVLKNKPSPQ